MKLQLPQIKMDMRPTTDKLLLAAYESHCVLNSINVNHIFIGGLAIYFHGGRDYQTRDVDILIEDSDRDRVGHCFGSIGYGWHGFRKAYVSHQGVRVEAHWKGKHSLPSPSEVATTDIDGLPIVSLVHLVEMKIESDLAQDHDKKPNAKHREHLDRLIRVNRLTNGFASYLQPALRDRFSTYHTGAGSS